MARAGRALCLLAALLWGFGALGAEERAGEAAGSVAYLAVTDGYWQVWTMTPEGGEQRQITTSPCEKVRVSWFPGGRGLLVNRLDGRFFKVDVASGREREIPFPLDGTQDAVLSPSGEEIAFSADIAGGRDGNAIWVMNVDGTGLRKMVDMPALQHEPQWSRDGRWIYFLSGEGKQSHDIWRVSTETRSREQLTVGQLYHFDLALSPDGVLAFSGNRSGNYEIWIWDRAAGEAPRRITDDAALDGCPTWSPDGRSLIFHSSRSGRLNLWRVSAEGGAPRQLTRDPDGAREPVWWHPGEGVQ